MIHGKTQTKTESHGTWSYALLFISVLFCLLSCFSVLARSARAKNVSSDSYKIQMGDVNMGAGLPTSDNYNLGLTGGQTAPGLFAANGYQILSGFWYIKTIIPFSFTIDNLAIDFGTLTPNQFSTKTNFLTVSAGGAGGYQVTASESAVLTSFGGTATIPNTSCNGGTNTCIDNQAKPWTDTHQYGFGYNMSGTDIPTDFLDPTYYRPFTASTSAIIMSSADVTRNPPSNTAGATVTYQINISGSQAAGDYENYILFIATPSY